MTSPGPHVDLHLAGCCIETAGRREHARLSRLALSGEVELDEELQDRFELLRRFLERVDFGALRSARPELSGLRDLRVRVRERDGRFEVDEIEVAPSR
jgi:hypothetical protein